MDKPIVELRHIFKRYHENEVLKDVSISFDMSSIHSIVGENGAGKSTLTKILCGVIPKSKGSIVFQNKTVNFKSVKAAQGKPVTDHITTPGVWWDINNYEELIDKKIVYHG